MEERRAHPRVRIRRRVFLRLSSGEWVPLWSHDMSQGGLQLLSDRSADPGDVFYVSFHAFDFEENTYVPVECRARIIHIIYDGTAQKFRLGLEFVEFTEGSEAPYRRYVEYMLRRNKRLR